MMVEDLSAATRLYVMFAVWGNSSAVGMWIINVDILIRLILPRLIDSVHKARHC